MACTAKVNREILVITSDDGKSLGIQRSNLCECPVPTELDAETEISFVFILGLFEVNSVAYIAFATSVETVCEFWNIQKVTGFRVVQLSQGSCNEHAEALLKQGLHLAPMYFSTTHDLSNTVVGQIERSPPRGEFVWNWVPVQSMLRVAAHCEAFVKHVIVGFVGHFRSPKYEFCLISRRSSVRAGTRFWVRGADKDGNVANFVETEQIVISDAIYSFVQIRGSVPLVWTQYPCLGQLPPIHLGPHEECREVLEKHFKSIADTYGGVIAVSLIDQKGREKALTERYNELGGQAHGVIFQYFDFHKECAKMHWENIDKLIQRIQTDISRFGYSKVMNGAILSRQTGVVRTNCLDCLDRTNVVQSVIARLILEKQLSDLGLQLDCDQHFRDTWTDNANAISCQYAGTPALKTDFTRTGKRSFSGQLRDIANSTARFYINTFNDGTRQDAYDAITQRVPCTSYTKDTLFIILIRALYACLIFIILFLTKGRDPAIKRFAELRSEAVNRPHFTSKT